MFGPIGIHMRYESADTIRRPSSWVDQNHSVLIFLLILTPSWLVQKHLSILVFISIWHCVAITGLMDEGDWQDLPQTLSNNLSSLETI